MDWNEFRNHAKFQASVDGISEEELKKYLQYAKRLVRQDLPVIVDPYSLARFIGIDFHYLCNMAYGTEHFYRNFSIPKKSGGTREISEPLPDLKQVQHWMLNNILNYIEISKYAKAYVKKQSVKTNARFHRGQKVLVSMDVKDFFPSIKKMISFMFFMASDMLKMFHGLWLIFVV